MTLHWPKLALEKFDHICHQKISNFYKLNMDLFVGMPALHQNNPHSNPTTIGGDIAVGVSCSDLTIFIQRVVEGMLQSPGPDRV